jgi:hypothetical protein
MIFFCPGKIRTTPGLRNNLLSYRIGLSMGSQKSGRREKMRKRPTQFLVLLISFALVGAFAHPGLGQEKPKAAAPQEMVIARAVVGTGVEKMEPVGAGETFPASTEKVFCFIEANNIPKDTEVSFVWSQGGKEVRKINLPLKAGPKWRTWANKNVGGQKGDWKVEIKDAEGKLLKEVKFKVE